MLIHNAIIACDGQCRRGWLRTSGALISEAGTGDAPATPLSSESDVLDAKGAILMPGMIDTHVHFREPGLTHKATIASESRAALAGGVTTVFDMPNCIPPTLTLADIRQKREIASRSAIVRMKFFIGASSGNLNTLRALDADADSTWLAGIKLFMGSSTGNMAVGNDSAVEQIFKVAAEKNLILMIHAEDDAIIGRNISSLRMEKGLASGDDIDDIAMHSRIRSTEACLNASRRAVELALRHGTRLHIAHLTSAKEVEMLQNLKSGGCKHISAEATPLHLTFCADDYASLGTRIKVNPAVKTAADRHALREAVKAGIIDTIGTDHAPHLPNEKNGGALRAASGAPMVQFALPLLLSLFTPETVAGRFAESPARLFGLADRGHLHPGQLADMVLVRQCAPYTVADSDASSPCGWTPLAGLSLNHRIERVWSGGEDVTEKATHRRLHSSSIE